MAIMNVRSLLYGSIGAAVMAFTYNRFSSPATPFVIPEFKPQMTTFDIEDGPKHSRRIVAVGDIHGDHQNMLRVLRMSKLIDEKGVWIAGEDIFVNTGDCVDRGHDTIAVYDYLIKLKQQAQAAGGRVTLLLGNHEVMNAMGDWRYVTGKDIDSFGGVQNRKNMMGNEGWIGRAWLTHFMATARIPLSSISTSDTSIPSTFHDQAAISAVHGGISSQFAQGPYLPYPSSLNNISHGMMSRFLTELPTNDISSKRIYLPHGTTPLEQSLLKENALFWYRGYANLPEKTICDQAHEVAKKIGVRRLIMGHTPQSTITSRCNGRVWLIDTGISKIYGGVLSSLVINHDLYQSRNGRWVENEKITALHDGYEPEVKLDEWRYVE